MVYLKGVIILQLSSKSEQVASVRHQISCCVTTQQQAGWSVCQTAGGSVGNAHYTPPPDESTSHRLCALYLSV